MQYTHLLCFFFNDTATTQIYTLSLHDALPIVLILLLMPTLNFLPVWFALSLLRFRLRLKRSEERFSRNAETDLVCRLLLEKKKKKKKTKRKEKTKLIIIN